jgi:serine/threonine-protein kinase
VNETQRALFGPFALNLRRGCLTRDGEEVHLRRQTYEVLRYLVDHDGRLIGKDELIDRVWKGRAVTDGSLGKCIEEIREALGPSSKLYVRNVRGRGYLFDSSAGGARQEDADGVAMKEGADKPRVAGTSNDLPGLSRRRVSRRVSGMVLVIGVAALAVLVTNSMRSPVASAVPSHRAAIRVQSLAILPFRPTDAARGDGSLELGMADAVIIRLGVLSGITVRPLSAVRQYTDPALDATSIGRKLGVDAVLEGHIQRFDARVRVSARLLQVKDGRQLWADSFDGPFGDIFVVQDVVAERVARALAMELTGEQLRQLTKRYTDNITAYQHYLKGRQHVLALTRQDLFAAQASFERAITEDGNYALAYAGLADVYTNLVPRGLIAGAEGRAQAQAMARKALSLDVDLPEAHAAIGQVLVYAAPFDFEAGDRALRRAIQLNGNLALAHQFLGVSLLVQGRIDDALVEWRIAREIDPLSPRIARMLAYAYLLKGQHQRAIALVRETRSLGPAFTIFPEIEIYVIAGATQEAETEIRKTDPGRDKDPVLLFSRAILSAAQGRTREAVALAERLERESPANAVPAHLIAGIHSTLGDQAAALAWLERAVDAGMMPMFYKDSALWSRLHGTAQFSSLLRRMGVPEL